MKSYFPKVVLIVMSILYVGCCSDLDNDGVCDDKDECPETPNEVKVDDRGCSIEFQDDDDKDGVKNDRDRCPNTPALDEGLEVDDKGCLKNAVSSFDGASKAEEHPNQIILSGISGLPPGVADEIQQSLGVDDADIQTCSCDKDIQLWPLPAGFDMDNAVAEAESKGGGKLAGDKNFVFNIVPEHAYLGILPESGPVSPIIKNDPQKPVIAILDSGLDLEQLDFDGLQLLDTEEINDILCTDLTAGENSGFGRNFVDGNSDMSKDPTSHGTNVVKTFVKGLKNLNLGEFQILPLKLFSDDGEGSYWNIVCAFSYLNKLKTDYDITIVNTSFGAQLDSFESDKDLMVLKELIDSLNETLVVSSAGNNGNNNDDTPHFPASYNSPILFNDPSKNIMAVAGHDSQDPPNIFDVSSQGHGSNFGKKTVNLAAPWHFTIVQQGFAQISQEPKTGLELFGTSYSAPFTAALLLEYYFDNGRAPKGEQLKNNFLHNSGDIVINSSLGNLVIDNKYVK